MTRRACELVHCAFAPGPVSFVADYCLPRRCEMPFDDTLTDDDFRRALRDSHDELLAGPVDAEPDLRVEGLSNSLLAKLLGLFRGSGG